MLAKFMIPAIPPSVNHMVKPNFRTKTMYLDESVRSFKRIAFPCIPPLVQVKEGSHLTLSVEYHAKFYNNDGTIKRKDGQNLDKCLYDIIFAKWGLDDSMVFKGYWEKIHDPEKEFTIVEVRLQTA